MRDCSLVADGDGYQHALRVRSTGAVRLFNRREPRRPDDMEDRGEVTNLERIKAPED